MKIVYIFLAFIAANTHGIIIKVDTSKAPKLARFGRGLKAALEQVYPIMYQIMYSPTIRPLKVVTVVLDPRYSRTGTGRTAQAEYATSTIRASVAYYLDNQNDFGTMIHEMTHLLQQYKSKGNSAKLCPSWLREGIADVVRYYYYEPFEVLQKPKKTNKYTDEYKISAYFLEWMDRKYPRSLYWINRSCREGMYSEKIFPKMMKKTVRQLWNEMMNSPPIGKRQSLLAGWPDVPMFEPRNPYQDWDSILPFL